MAKTKPVEDRLVLGISLNSKANHESAISICREKPNGVTEVISIIYGELAEDLYSFLSTSRPSGKRPSQVIFDEIQKKGAQHE